MTVSMNDSTTEHATKTRAREATMTPVSDKSFDQATAALRADVSGEFLSHLIELDILHPDAEGRLSVGDLRRIQLTRTMERAGISIEEMAKVFSGGQLSLDFLDMPLFERFATNSGESFAEAAKRTGLPLDILMLLREVIGSASPEPGDLMREDELELLPFIEAQLRVGIPSEMLARGLRVMGENLRRIAEVQSESWRTAVMEPMLARGMSMTESWALGRRGAQRRAREAHQPGVADYLPCPRGSQLDIQYHQRLRARPLSCGGDQSPGSAAGHVFLRHHRLYSSHRRAG